MPTARPAPDAVESDPVRRESRSASHANRLAQSRLWRRSDRAPSWRIRYMTCFPVPGICGAVRGTTSRSIRSSVPHISCASGGGCAPSGTSITFCNALMSEQVTGATPQVECPSARCPGPATEPAPAVTTLWYKDAIIYEVHVRAFSDSNDDGIGDFAGLTRKLDYLQDLGVNALWLLPFYPSPLRDDGYDIADYRNPSRSTARCADFRALRPRGAQRGLRIITELVINHTSDQHPWFQAARAPPGSPQRNFYVWSDTTGAIRRHADHLHRYRDLELGLGSGGEGLLLAPLLQPSARSELRQSARGARASLRVMRLLARHGGRRPAAGRDSLPRRARGHQQREPAARPMQSCKRIRTAIDERYRGPHAPRRGQPVAGGRAASISATATNATWHFTSR